MDVAAFRAGVFVLFVFIPQINLGVDKPLHQIAVELIFFSVDSPADVTCEGDAKENSLNGLSQVTRWSVALSAFIGQADLVDFTFCCSKCAH
ncbi:hypothetical protein CRN32_16960 [Vibrio vulnificus]|nr:hypothetical protein [Vibrio vulnificus]POC49962.1 hypothetical protein CRN32_16960 [Vibrio vulnificus]RZQ92033.1 hypothetical protein D8T27_02125 [Vibrio vulnificus]